MTEVDAPDRIIVRSDTEITGANGGQALVRQAYQPPLDGKSDDYAGFDMQVARGIGELLNKHYFGYPWKAFADTKQGVVGFSIPALMGDTLHMIINLKQFSDLQPQLIVDRAGQLLERMGLPRDRRSMEAILAAVEEAKQRRHTFQFNDKRLQ